MAKDMCKNLVPKTDIVSITQAQKETADALGRILKFGSISFSGLKDIRPSILRLNVGSTLGMGELLAISSLLDLCAKTKSFGRKLKREDEDEDFVPNPDDGPIEDYFVPIDSLDLRFQLLEPLTPLNTEIKRCILSEEEMSDDASSGLKQIRRSIQITNSRVHEQLNQIVNASSTKTMLRDNLITMRNGRYCLPIKQEYKTTFSGMVHDQSSTGSTVFMEPMAVVKLNNELRDLAIQ